jgi:hypothetical protein
MVAVGTDKGRVLVYQWNNLSKPLLFKTKAGVAYGPVTGVEIQGNGEFMVAATETGEIIQYELLTEINKEILD